MNIGLTRRWLRSPTRVFSLVAAAVVLSLGLAPAAVATPSSPSGTASQSTAVPAPYPYPDSGSASVPLVLDTAASCTPYVDGDNVHVSSGDASAHGWWYRGSCANQKTTVTIYLYEYFSDGLWHWQGTGSAYVWPGGGSGNRATVRQVCTGVIPAGWRSLVVVKLGNGASAYTPAQNIACRHPLI
jgi:hypothetical protein